MGYWSIQLWRSRIASIYCLQAGEPRKGSLKAWEVEGLWYRSQSESEGLQAKSTQGRKN